MQFLKRVADESLKLKFLAGFLIFFHLVGLIGITLTPYRSWFLNLSPLNLLLTLVVICWFIPKRNQSQVSAAVFIYAISYLVEVLGVATGFPFGVYSYGENLGFKWFEVPIMIGVNWLILVIATISFAPQRWNLVSKSAFSASLLVALDVLIEQVAPSLDYWAFDSPSNLIQNYIAWWILSFTLSVIGLKYKLQTHRKLGWIIYLIQAIFFLIILFKK